MRLDLPAPLRFVGRGYARNRILFIGATLSLTLAVTSVAVTFGVVDRLLIRPMPAVASPSQVKRLTFIEEFRGRLDTLGGSNRLFLEQLRANAVIGQAAGALYPRPFTLGLGAEASSVDVQPVTGEFFQLLGVAPDRGRLLLPSDDLLPEGTQVAVASFAFWRRNLGGDPQAIGRTLVIQGKPFTLVGVAPRAFSGIDQVNVDLWIPVSSIAASLFGQRWPSSESWWLPIVIRVDRRIDETQAAAGATVVYRAFERSLHSAERDSSARVVLSSLNPMLRVDGMRAEAKVSLWLMVVCVAVLLVACGNVANLLITRAVRRRRELAVRIALGADSLRIARLLLLDVVAIAVPATVLAHFATPLLADTVRTVLLPGLPGEGVAFDGRIMVVTSVLGLACVALVGMAPLLQARNPRIIDGLSSTASASVHVGRLRNALVAFQAAFSVILLIGAVLFIVSLRRVAARDVGMDADQVVRLTMPLRAFGFDANETDEVFREARERLLRVPGVVAVAAVRYSVPFGTAYLWRFTVPGADPSIARELENPLLTIAGSDYLRVLGTELVEGRAFTELEEREPTRAVIISDVTARAFWPRGSALGECVFLGSDSVCTRVIGVMKSVIHHQLVGEKRMHFIAPPNHPGFEPGRASALVVRTASRSADLVPALRAAVQGISPRLPFVRIEPYADLIAPQMRPWRLGASLFTAFGVIALVIASVGMYCVLAYWVAQRTREIAVRVALGARSGDVVRLVTSQGLGSVAIGLAAGELVALVGYPLLSNLLFETSPRDPAVYAGIALVLVLAATIATLVPAWRAVRVPAAMVLRMD